jgi:hypothetical protein
MMRVEELIAILQTMPPDSRVGVMGYESGYDEVTLVKELAILPEENPSWYNGRFDTATDELADQAEQAVLVFGRNAEE